MSDPFAHLPYRPCVGVMLVNPDGLAFVGRRIDTRATDFKHSAQFSDGRKDAAAKKPFSPPDSKRLGAQAVLEYGHGYLAGLLDALPAAVKSPVLTEAEHNAMMKGGRR